MWKNKKVSVVFSTYNEKDSIREVIELFFASGYVDEIVVVNNNAVAGTVDEVAKTNARQVFEPLQGYGFGYQRGLREAQGDIIIMSEPDGTFLADDVVKLLAYGDHFDVVFGSRTTSATLLRGANMGLFLKWGNWFIAKIVELLFSTTHLSDVGCTMRLVHRSALDKIQPRFQCGGSNFGTEMMLHVISNSLRFVEIPLHYKERVGSSSVTGSYWKAFLLGIAMIKLVLMHKLREVIKK